MDDLVCAFCEMPVDATWLVCMGSAECTNVIEYYACDVHMDVLRKAAAFADDECDPPHRIDELMFWDVETKTEPETVYPTHESRDALSLTRALVPKYVECEVCGKRYRTVAEAIRCRADDRTPAASFTIRQIPLPPPPARVMPAPLGRPVTYCMKCGQSMPFMQTSDICPSCITKKMQSMMRRMKRRE